MGKKETTELVEVVKNLLQEEMKWEQCKRQYLIALDEQNRKNHIRAANRKIAEVQRKYWQLVKQ